MRFRMIQALGVLTILTSFQIEHTHASDWLRFRGPNGSGVSPDRAPAPETFKESENLKWVAQLPGPGSSSPIIVGDKVFVTCWSGYAVDAADLGSQKNLKRHLVCIDRTNGKPLWTKDVDAVLPEDEFGGMFAEHGYASHTPVSDGEKVFVFFGKTGVLAFDLEGNQLWHESVGTDSDPRGWGSASSPILYKELVIVTASAESESIVALNKNNGKEEWRQKAGGLSGTWGTPILVNTSEDRAELVIGVPYEIWALNPDTGKLRWYCEAMDTQNYCSSVVASDQIIFGIEGRGGGAISLRAGGKDDVTKSNVIWSGRGSSTVTTPIVYSDRMYYISNQVLNCLDAKTGESVYQGRLTGGTSRGGNRSGNPAGGGGRGARGGFGGFPGGLGGQDYSSPIVADGKLYLVSRNGDLFIARLGDMFEQLSASRIANGDAIEDFSATPAVSDGQLFVRSSKNLYCIASKKSDQ